MSDRIADELVRVIRKYSGAKNKEAITLETPLEATGVDSLGMAEAIFELEDIFQVSLPDPMGGQPSSTRSLGDLHAMIAGLVPKA